MASGKFHAYIQLTRLNRPIGALLLLWPTLWALWLAADGLPRTDVLFIFVLGTFVMRSAGCIINDYADRNVDGAVARTRDRPLVTGAVSTTEALTLFAVLLLLAFFLVLFTNPLTISLSVIGVLLASAYPYMKRYTHLPQIVLGAAFSWAIPMAFAAQSGELPQGMWLLYIANVLWTVAYDTEYAMVDREDDLKVGIKSTAILFGDMDRIAIGALHVLTLVALLLVGLQFSLGLYYYAGVAAAAALLGWQHVLIANRAPPQCFKAFLNNNYVGLVIFIGIAVDIWLRQAPAAA